MSQTDTAPIELRPSAAGDRESVRSLVFRVAGRVYACDVDAVREVVPLERLTRLPGAPPVISGLINVRGAVVTVVNAAYVLHPAEAPRPQRMVLIVDAGQRGVGLSVERVADVRMLRDDEGYTDLDVRELVRRVVIISEEQ
ncbi:MAG: chemotaxis protein CheW [Gemmatimonadota bacterium]|nr:chemotaxis protein CheW [Gemmatimonadota bacterium]